MKRWFIRSRSKHFCTFFFLWICHQMHKIQQIWEKFHLLFAVSFPLRWQRIHTSPVSSSFGMSLAASGARPVFVPPTCRRLTTTVTSSRTYLLKVGQSGPLQVNSPHAGRKPVAWLRLGGDEATCHRPAWLSVHLTSETHSRQRQFPSVSTLNSKRHVITHTVSPGNCMWKT